MTTLAKVPCTIVTGFLGAGKTTLVRHVLENANGRRLAVIVNEFGDVGIDGEILKSCGIESCPADAIVGVGILAALASRSVGVVLVFSAALIAGVGIHLAKVDVPVSELLVALSTLAIGALILLRRSIRPAAAAALFAIAGLLHGYALGESIVGAEASPLIAYLAGLLVIQTLIGVAAYALTKRVGALRPAGLTAAGLLVVLMGGVSTAIAANALI